MTDRRHELQKVLEGFHALKACFAARHRSFPEGKSLTGSEWLVLGFIARKPGSSIKEIGASLDISSSAVTQLVAKLIRSGHVVKRPDQKDGRAVVITLSPTTKKNLAKMHAALERHLSQVFAALSDHEFETYIRLNEKIIEQSRKQPV